MMRKQKDLASFAWATKERLLVASGQTKAKPAFGTMDAKLKCE
jgi:hypothetical protein